MQIQVNTDHNIEGHEALADQIRDVVESALNRVSDHITRVEVHLSDENGDKGGPNDKRCMMEARLEGRQPVAVTQHAATLEQAVDGAADKLIRLIESTLGRRHDRESRRTDPPPPGTGNHRSVMSGALKGGVVRFFVQRADLQPSWRRTQRAKPPSHSRQPLPRRRIFPRHRLR